MIENLLDFLSKNPPGLWTGPVLFLVSFTETIFPPVPGDILFIVLSGWAMSGGMAVSTAVLSGVGGCFAASCILFLLGQRPGRRLVDGWLKKRVEVERVERATDLVSRHGPVILAGSRFIPGVRSLLVVIAGASHMSFGKAVLPIAFSAGAWYLILSAAGSVFGRNLEAARGFMHQFETWIWLILATGLVLFVLLKLIAGRRRKREE